MPEFVWYIVAVLGVAFALYFVMIIGLVLKIIFGKDDR